MEPTVTPELIGILAVGATVIGLLLTFRRDARADNQACEPSSARTTSVSARKFTPA